MDRDALQATARAGIIRPLDGTRVATDVASPRHLARKAWLVRAAAVTFLVGGGIVSYLLFSAV